MEVAFAAHGPQNWFENRLFEAVAWRIVNRITLVLHQTIQIARYGAVHDARIHPQ